MFVDLLFGYLLFISDFIDWSIPVPFPLGRVRVGLRHPLQISSAGWAVAVFHTRQPTQRATSRATMRKMPT